MRQCFFEKGTQVRTPFGEFVLAQNKLDSHHYALERIQNCSNDYIYDFYSSFEDSHFLRYYTCWEEEESIVKKAEKEESTEVKGSKKKTMNLASFLSKKKAEISEPTSAKVDPISKSKKEIEPKKQQTVKVKAVYIQLDAFEQLKKPHQVEEIKSLMALVYLLAQAVYQNLSFWPNMIPVAVGLQGSIRFVKKGKSRNKELTSLFQQLMKQKQIGEWSKQMPSIYEMYKINNDIELLGEKIHDDLSKLASQEYEVTMKMQGKKKEQKVKVIQPEVLLIVQTGHKINLAQYTVVSSFNGQNTKEITLEHYIEDQIVIIGEYSNFIVRYLKTFRIK